MSHLLNLFPNEISVSSLSFGGEAELKYRETLSSATKYRLMFGWEIFARQVGVNLSDDGAR